MSRVHHHAEQSPAAVEKFTGFRSLIERELMGNVLQAVGFVGPFLEVVTIRCVPCEVDVPKEGDGVTASAKPIAELEEVAKVHGSQYDGTIGRQGGFESIFPDKSASIAPTRFGQSVRPEAKEPRHAQANMAQPNFSQPVAAWFRDIDRLKQRLPLP